MWRPRNIAATNTGHSPVLRAASSIVIIVEPGGEILKQKTSGFQIIVDLSIYDVTCQRKQYAPILRLSNAMGEILPVPSIRPTLQSLYFFDSTKSAWQPKISVDTINTVGPSTLSILTWNIDFSSPLPILRLRTLLSHIEQLLAFDSPQPPPPTVILFQEFHESCFPTLLSTTFVRVFYDVSDITPSSWRVGFSYGTIMLIPKSLSAHISSVSRTPFPSSKMGRDVLYADLELHLNRENSSAEGSILRIANTHLESLRGHGDIARVAQLTSISALLGAPGVHGGLVAGDMNAISPSDLTLPADVGLVDAWEDGAGGVLVGHTWGYQPPGRFPPSRLDKILISGGLVVEAVERVGVGLQTAGSSDERRWVSDHYGLYAKVNVVPTEATSVPL